MNPDLSAETGPVEPGLAELLRTLTAGPAPGELAGEGDALAMFRANAGQSATALTTVLATEAPAPPEAAGGRQAPRRLRWSARWAIAAATAVTLCGGMTAAAYAAVLPAPVQHLAHDVFGAVGVPDAQHQPSSSGPGGRSLQPGAAGSRRTSPGAASPSSSAGGPAPGPSASASSSPGSASAPRQLLASASASIVTAGSQVVIEGQLQSSGAGVPGTEVTLWERLTGQAAWQNAGNARTNSAGNVAVTVPVLTQNAVFRLAGTGAVSPAVLVRVSPLVSAVLEEGSGGVFDVLAVSTQDAQSGNEVVLQVETASGWAYVRENRLTAAGTTSFTLSGKRLQNRQVRAELLGTLRHAGSISNQVTVPPPG